MIPTDDLRGYAPPLDPPDDHPDVLPGERRRPSRYEQMAEMVADAWHAADAYVAGHCTRDDLDWAMRGLWFRDRREILSWIESQSAGQQSGPAQGE